LALIGQLLQAVLPDASILRLKVTKKLKSVILLVVFCSANKKPRTMAGLMAA
jgi:hypothetical protein